MQSLKYIWRNVMRNKLRSFLTVSSVGISLTLMTLLYGYIAMQDFWGEEAEQYNRIVVMNTQGFSGLLPIAYVDRVRSVEGVKAAVPYAWYGGKYKDEQQMRFAQFGTDPEQVFDVWSEFKIDPQQLKAFQETRRGCVADRRLAAQEGWEIGDRIPLVSEFYQFPLDLELCGTFDAETNTGSIWFNWDYLNEGLKQVGAPEVDNSGTIFAKAANADVIPSIVKQIDDRFGSSENPTRTQTEQAFAQMFADMFGNLRLLFLLVGIVVAFSLMLVTANSMAMSMRERTTEIAVLKAIGFSRGQVLRLVLGEACMIAFIGGVLGIGFGCLLIQVGNGMMPQFLPLGILDMVGPWLLILAAVAAGVGLASGFVPAVRASQLRVVDGLRQV